MKGLTPQQVKNVQMFTDFCQDLNQQTMNKVWFLVFLGILVIAGCVYWWLTRMDQLKEETE